MLVLHDFHISNPRIWMFIRPSFGFICIYYVLLVLFQLLGKEKHFCRFETILEAKPRIKPNMSKVNSNGVVAGISILIITLA